MRSSILGGTSWLVRWRAVRSGRRLRPLLRLGVLVAILAAAPHLRSAVTAAAPQPAVREAVFEAELCRDLTFPWQPVAVAGASAGYALAIPEGAGSSEAFTPGQEGRARFAIPPGTDGDRDLWLRVYWNGNCSNSLFVRHLPDGRLLTVTDSIVGSWHWVKVPGADVSAAADVLVLENREDGVWLDQLCLRPRGSSAPVGILAAVTAWPPPDPSLPAVSVTACAAAAGVEALPPTEYLLHHTREIRHAMSRQPLLVLFPGRETGLDVWLRWNHPQAGPVTVDLDPAADVVATALPVPASTTASAALERRSFVLRAHPDLARGLSRLRCRVRSSDGLEQVHELRLLRPYRWLVSSPFRLNPAAGLEPLADQDRAILAEPLAAAHDLRWRVAEPGDFTPFGLLDLRRAVSDQPFRQAYAFARVTAAQAGPATLDLTHDDWVRVWLNGACVFSAEDAAPSTLSRARVPVVLQAGENEVLVRSCQLKNYWEFGLVIEPGPAAAPEVPPDPAPSAAAPPYVWGGLSSSSAEGLAEDLSTLVADCPPDETWQVVAAICRQVSLDPVQPWWRLAQSLRYLLRTPDDRLHGATALLELRRRAFGAALSDDDRVRLVALTFRERAALLAAASRPLEAAEETLAAVCWTTSPRERQDLHAEVVHLFLSAAAPAEAAAYLEVTAAETDAAPGLRGVVALYNADLEAAAAGYAQASPDLIRRHSGWMLRLGRAAEAEWLLRRVASPSSTLRVMLAQACAEQRRFAEAEVLLTDCLLDATVVRSGWESAAAELVRFHAARCSLHPAAAAVRLELAQLSHHAEARQVRLLHLLAGLEREAGEPVAALQAALAEAEATAQSYRPFLRSPLDSAGLMAGVSLLAERRYAEVLELCNAALAVLPGQRPQLGVWRLQALLGLGRPAAAEAVLAQLRPSAVRDPAQARLMLEALVVSPGTAIAVERLARIVLDSHAGDPALAGDAAITLAYAAAARGDSDRVCQDLERALELRRPPGSSLAAQVELCRSWVARSLRLAREDEPLRLALQASPCAALRLAEATFSADPGAALAARSDDPASAMALPAAAERFLAAMQAALLGPAAPDAAAAPGGKTLSALLRYIEPGLPPRRWVLVPGGFPRCDELEAGVEPTSFDEALRAYGEPLPVGHTVIFLHGLVWVGTDRGLFCYRREAERWDRLHLPAAAADTPVTSLVARDGTLLLGWTSAAGEARLGSFDPAAAAWTVPALP